MALKDRLNDQRTTAAGAEAVATASTMVLVALLKTIFFLLRN